jgi:hypothetical protein
MTMKILALKCKLPYQVLPHVFNEMKSYLHIGIGKTGSFAIHFFCENGLFVMAYAQEPY